MNQAIAEQLRKRPGRIDHAALPSIRVLARHFRVSPASIQAVLRHLARRKEVYVLARKGYFWGPGPAPASALPVKDPPRPLQIERDLLDEMHSGYLDPFGRLPSLKILAERHRASTRTLSRILASLAGKGVLRREGRGYRLEGKPPGPANGVILVTRCDATGQLGLDTDRELDFMKAVYQECRALGLDLKILGYAGSGDFLDRQGRKTAPLHPGRQLLGFLVSTWLMPDPAKVLERLQPLRQPISVWWEHPVEGPDLVRRASGRIAYFNLAFGEAPGALIAEALLSQGHTRVLFLSPFHLSRWSQQRLQGLRDGMRRHPEARVHALTSDAHASPWSFRQEARQELRARGPLPSPDHPAVLRRKNRNLTAVLRRLLRARPAHPPATAWVCVNDEVAEIAFELIKKTPGLQPPYLVSFDNSAASYRRQIDSFDFNTPAMVRQMLYHLSHPSAALFSLKAFIEIPGRLMRK